MLTKPLLEEFLWKGKIQLANYPKPVQKPPMDLPKMNGRSMYYPVNHFMCDKTEEMSRQYWREEWVRRVSYRERMRMELYAKYMWKN